MIIGRTRSGKPITNFVVISQRCQEGLFKGFAFEDFLDAHQHYLHSVRDQARANNRLMLDRYILLSQMTHHKMSQAIESPNRVKPVETLRKSILVGRTKLGKPVFALFEWQAGRYRSICKRYSYFDLIDAHILLISQSYLAAHSTDRIRTQHLQFVARLMLLRIYRFVELQRIRRAKAGMRDLVRSGTHQLEPDK